MDWCDVDDILIDGDKDSISKIVCPECGSKIKYQYDRNNSSMKIECDSCGYLARASGYPFPNCVRFFGDSAIV